jgi:hypothetical protein
VTVGAVAPPAAVLSTDRASCFATRQTLGALWTVALALRVWQGARRAPAPASNPIPRNERP